MNAITRRIIAIFSLVLLFTVTASAQAAIEKAIKTLENDPNVDISFSERRDPETKEITKSTCTYVIKSEALISMVEKAFMDERANSTYVNKHKKYTYIKFKNGTKYVLDQRDAKSATLVVVSGKSSSSKDNSISFNNDYNFSNDYHFNTLSPSIYNQRIRIRNI
jgi:beta-phosphoglucomutase-like phosphatase (HAD superfamily)